MDYLLFESGQSPGNRIELDKDCFVLGRGPDCEIRLRDHKSSRRHARLFFSGQRWWVEDLGSRNGTLLNGQPLSRAQALSRGDQIAIGKTRLAFHCDVDVIDQTWADQPALSSPPEQATHFEDTADPEAFQSQEFDLHSLEILFQVASILNAGMRLSKMARECLEALRNFYKAQTASLFLADPTRQPIRPALILSEDPSPMVSQTVVWHSMQSRRAICVRDSGTELPQTDVLNVMGRGQSRSLMCAPLLHRDKVFGAIAVDREGRNHFDYPALALFTALAHLVGGAVRQAQKIEQLESAARASQQDQQPVEELEGDSAAIVALRDRIAEVANSDDPVLIVGERGTDVREFARQVHGKSPRAHGPLIWLNPLAEEPNQLAAVIFGKTDEGEPPPDAPGSGRLEAAHGGTLVIEAVGALPPEVQTLLLAYLRTLKFQRVGGQRRYFADTRLVATAIESWEELATAGVLKADFLQAFGGLVVKVPPLRARGNDLVDLARRMVAQLAPLAGRRQITLSDEAAGILRAYHWPCNMQELRHVIQWAVLRCGGDELTAQDLPAELVEHAKSARQPTQIQ